MHRARRVVAPLARFAPLVFLTLCVGVASAHQIHSSFEAPLPLGYLFVGAGLTVAATAGWLGVRADSAAAVSSRRLAAIPPAVAAPLRTAARLGFFLLFCLALWVGLTGRQVPADNFATLFVWPVWLRGVGLVAILFGSPWAVLSPWRTVYAALSRLEGRDIAVLGPYPERLATWPAVVGFVCGVGVVENLTVIPSSPSLTAAVVAIYAAVMVLGGLAFGPDWFRRADALAVLYRLFGRVAPVRARRTPDGGYRLRLRPPWEDCLAPVGRVSTVAFVVATVYTVSFDGFLETPEYQSLLYAVRDVLPTGPLTGLALYVVGFLAFLAFFFGAASLVERGGARTDARTAALAFAPTVLPISVAYEFSHNYAYVLENLGRTVEVGSGALLASSVSVSLVDWLSLPLFWASQVALIVLGHVAAVVAAHYAAVERYPTAADARRAHGPLVALMVGYTMLSLWIISRPVVTG